MGVFGFGDVGSEGEGSGSEERRLGGPSGFSGGQEGVDCVSS